MKKSPSQIPERAIKVIRLGEMSPFSMKIPTFQMKLKPCINRSKSIK